MPSQGPSNPGQTEPQPRDPYAEAVRGYIDGTDAIMQLHYNYVGERLAEYDLTLQDAYDGKQPAESIPAHQRERKLEAAQVMDSANTLARMTERERSVHATGDDMCVTETSVVESVEEYKPGLYAHAQHTIEFGKVVKHLYSPSTTKLAMREGEVIWQRSAPDEAFEESRKELSIQEINDLVRKLHTMQQMMTRFFEDPNR